MSAPADTEPSAEAWEVAYRILGREPPWKSPLLYNIAVALDRFRAAGVREWRPIDEYPRDHDPAPDTYWGPNALLFGRGTLPQMVDIGTLRQERDEARCSAETAEAEVGRLRARLGAVIDMARDFVAAQDSEADYDRMLARLRTVLDSCAPLQATSQSTPDDVERARELLRGLKSNSHFGNSAIERVAAALTAARREGYTSRTQRLSQDRHETPSKFS